MKILHLFSNTRLRGAAEPVLNLTKALKDRGHTVYFACGEYYPGQKNEVEDRAAEIGLEIPDFRLHRHLKLANCISDIPQLVRLIEEEEIEIVHTHLLSDHLVGGWATRQSSRKVNLVRSMYSFGSLWQRLRTRRLTKGITDAVIVAGNLHRRKALRLFGLPAERIRQIAPAVDLERFNPERQLPDIRVKLSLDEGAFVVGIVTRIERYRKLDLFLKVIRLTYEKVPHLRAVIIGGGAEEIARATARRLGIESVVRLAGEIEGDELVAALGIMDVNIFLVPGTDRTYHHLRQAQAMGCPVIAPDRGLLPEIIDSGTDGYLLDKYNPKLFAGRVIGLAKNEWLLGEMSKAAAAKARRRFAPDPCAEEVEKVYQFLIRSPRIEIPDSQ